MALINAVCPQCGATTELETARDFGFCQSCGAKIMLEDAVSAAPSESPEPAFSGQAGSFFQLAEDSFASGNTRDAYEYYTKVLESEPMNPKALYMKGICAVYNSDPQTIRISDYVQGLIKAKEVAFANAGGGGTVLQDIEQKSLDLLQFWLGKGVPKQPESEEMGDCITQFSKAVNVSSLATAMVDAVYSEAAKEKIVNLTLPFIAAASKTKLQYYAGAQSGSDGKVNTTYKQLTATRDQQKALDDADAYLRKAYNELPSRVAKLKDINTRLHAAEIEVDKVKAELKSKRSERNSNLFARLKDRKDESLKAEGGELKGDIQDIKKRLAEAKNVYDCIASELAAFKETLK